MFVLKEGSDVYFLNRNILSPYKNVRSINDVAAYMNEIPQGMTLIFLVLESIDIYIVK
jgi:hypothetical protein